MPPLSETLVFAPANRLAPILGQAGQPAETLARRAERRVEFLKPNIRAYVAGRLHTIEALAAGPRPLTAAETRDLGHAAREICEVAGAAGLHAPGEAARGLYAMVDALAVCGVWRPDALQIHVAALSLLAADPDPEGAAEVLARLQALRDRIGVPR